MTVEIARLTGFIRKVMLQASDRGHAVRRARHGQRW